MDKTALPLELVNVKFRFSGVLRSLVTTPSTPL